VSERERRTEIERERDTRESIHLKKEGTWVVVREGGGRE